MDRYDFMSVVDEVFKDSNSVEDMVSRYVQMKKDLDGVFRDNIALIGIKNKDTEGCDGQTD